jgi:SAM-dependent methyltransferase
LDLGGDRRSGYHELLGIVGSFETVNINAELKPTYCMSLEERLPFPDGVFDHVISMNTFEHIKNDELAIAEALRVLRAGGTFHFCVSFCYRVHASPSDYHRHTAYWWLQFIENAGVKECTVEPLVWDQWSTAYALMNVRRGWRGLIMLLAFCEFGYWVRRVKDTVPFLRGLPWRPGAARIGAEERRLLMYTSMANYALGYYIRGIR